MSSRAGASWMAFGFVALLIYLNYRSKQSVDEFGRDRTCVVYRDPCCNDFCALQLSVPSCSVLYRRHLVPLAKRIDKESLMKELGVPQAQGGSQRAVDEIESALNAGISAMETKETLK